MPYRGGGGLSLEYRKQANGEFSTLAGTRPFFAAPLPHRSISHMVGVGPSGTFDERSSPPGNGPYPYDRRMVLQLQAHELALIDRLRARGTKTPKHRPKQTEAPLLGKCSWSAFDVVNSVLAVRSACLKRIQFLKSGPIVEVNVYPDVEPLVYRLRPLAWRFALSFQSYGFLSPSSCWTDPLYLSFLSECFSKPSFFQNLLRSSFFLRTQGKEDEPYYCKTQKIEQKKYSLTEGAKRKRGSFVK
ncbi:hypothetical protein L1987_89838 [Smallanthus sonchifolius]|nr:hypothetical protein L1987_89838 [Smallanthus sonchifolius]